MEELVGIFESNSEVLSTEILDKGLTSDQVLKIVSNPLIDLGFVVETSKNHSDKIFRPVLFGENGIPIMKYEIDAYNPDWNCGIEVEAGRAIMGNAIYRDIVQSLVMVDLDYLVLAVPNYYKYKSNGKDVISKDYDKTIAVVDALYSHSRIQMPYDLSVIGY